MNNYVLTLHLLKKVSRSRAHIVICMTIDFSIKQNAYKGAVYDLAFAKFSFYELNFEEVKKVCAERFKVITINFKNSTKLLFHVSA